MSHDAERDWPEPADPAELVPGFPGPPAPERRRAPGYPTGTGHFDVVLRGYDRHQVDEHVEELSDLVAELREELEDATAREAAAAEEAARARAELERGRPGFDALGERVASMLGLAEAEATELREQAEREAAQLREAARKDAKELRAQAERESAQVRSEAQQEADQRLARADAESRRMREEAAQAAEEMQADARGELDWLEQERITVLSELSTMRDTLSSILSRASAPRPTS